MEGCHEIEVLYKKMYKTGGDSYQASPSSRTPAHYYAKPSQVVPATVYREEEATLPEERRRCR